MKFTTFEIEAIRELVGSALDHDLLEAVLASDKVDVHFTGVGYFAAAAHEGLPKDRQVFHEPNVSGDCDCVDLVGFLVFVMDHELTLECHGYGDSVPEDFRDRRVSLRIGFPETTGG